MVCKNCGAEIKEGNLYCANCGHEAQIVPEYNIIDDFLELDISKIDDYDNTDNSLKENIEKNQNKKPKSDKTKLKIVIISLAFLIVLVISIFLLVNHNNNSYNYQISKAKESISNNNHKAAITYLSKALKIDTSDIDARWLLANELIKNNETDEAIVILNEIIKLDDDYYDAYDLLIEQYIELKDYDRAASIIDKADNSNINEKYSDYEADMPKFSHDSGTYNEKIVLTLESANSNEIYYTVDNSDPLKNGVLYKDSIELKSGDNIIKACTKNKYGVYSDVREEHIKLALLTPEPPIINPASGTYQEKEMIEITGDEDCTIYYTWDGSDPDITSEVYTGPIEMIPGNNILSAVSISKEGKMSRVTRANYIC